MKRSIEAPPNDNKKKKESHFVEDELKLTLTQINGLEPTLSKEEKEIQNKTLAISRRDLVQYLVDILGVAESEIAAFIKAHVVNLVRYHDYVLGSPMLSHESYIDSGAQGVVDYLYHSHQQHKVLVCFPLKPDEVVFLNKSFEAKDNFDMSKVFGNRKGFQEKKESTPLRDAVFVSQWWIEFAPALFKKRDEIHSWEDLRSVLKRAFEHMRSNPDYLLNQHRFQRVKSGSQYRQIEMIKDEDQLMEEIKSHWRVVAKKEKTATNRYIEEFEF
jgi:hypothetical protein